MNLQSVDIAITYTIYVSISALIQKKCIKEDCHSSSISRPGMYSKLTSKITGLLGATLGLPGAEVRPLGNANYGKKEKNFIKIQISEMQLESVLKQKHFHSCMLRKAYCAL